MILTVNGAVAVCIGANPGTGSLLGNPLNLLQDQTKQPYEKPIVFHVGQGARPSWLNSQDVSEIVAVNNLAVIIKTVMNVATVQVPSGPGAAALLAGPPGSLNLGELLQRIGNEQQLKWQLTRVTQAKTAVMVSRNLLVL